MKYTKIITHVAPHLDEIVAMWLLTYFGEKVFPGIFKAKVEYWKTGGSSPDGRTAEQYEQDGIILLGVGGGRFDEHPRPGRKRIEGQCTATLVAKALGLDDDLVFSKILKYTLDTDLGPPNSGFDLAYMVNLLNKHHADDPDLVIDWVFDALDAKHRQELELQTTVKDSFENDAKIQPVLGSHGRLLTMATVITDNPLVSKLAFSSQGGKAAVVIQKSSTGNVQILNNHEYGMKFNDLAQIIRLEEQIAKERIVTYKAKDLSAEGQVPGAEEWYFHHASQTLLNGGASAPNVPPTNLTLEQIEQAVRIGINPDSFESSRASQCQQGICNSSRSNPCPWYKYGLQRCRRIRYYTIHPVAASA